MQVPLGIDDLVGETRNKDNGKCNRYTRDQKKKNNSAMVEREILFPSGVISVYVIFELDFEE